MAHDNLNIAGLSLNIEGLPDDVFVELCEETAFFFECTPLERELLVRLGTALEVHSIIEKELLTEIDFLTSKESKFVIAASRRTAAKARLRAIFEEDEKSPPNPVTICWKRKH